MNNRCVYQDSRSIRGVLVSDDDLDAVELEHGQGIICGDHVEILLKPRTSKDDPEEAYEKRHGGFRWNGKQP
jgi:hypothetical protein